VALACFFLSLTPVVTFQAGDVRSGFSTAVSPLLWAPVPWVVVAACLLLLRRRQWPLAAFVASFVVAAAYLFAPTPVGGPLVIVTTYTLAVHRSSRACWVGLAIGVGVLTSLALGLAGSGVVSPRIAMNSIVGESVLGLIGALIGVNVGNRKRYLEAIIARSRQLLVERDQQAELAAAAERARIAREMHDIVSHNLTVVVALAEGANATADRERSHAAVAQIAETARGALGEMRAMLGVLRDPDVHAAAPLAPLTTATAMDAVAAAQRAGFPVACAVTGADDRLPAAVGFAAARIVQESLTNAMRHAPNATRIDVRIDHSAEEVRVRVDNDGVAATPPTAGGFGIRGLRERVAHLGGVLAAGPTSPGCWGVAASIPRPVAAGLPAASPEVVHE